MEMEVWGKPGFVRAQAASRREVGFASLLELAHSNLLTQAVSLPSFYLNYHISSFAFVIVVNQVLTTFETVTNR